MPAKTKNGPHFIFKLKFLVLENPIWGLAPIAVGSVALYITERYVLDGTKDLTWYMGFVATYLLLFIKFHADTNHKLFQTLESFNKRYTDLNQYLDGKSKETKDFVEDKIQDYINLCAEEYYFYSRGQIPEDVWKSWHSGMASAWKSDEVREVALREFPDPGLAPDPSYYGFNPYELGLLYANKPKRLQGRDSDTPQDQKLAKAS